MTESILIEIAQRFRRLEDAVEVADVFHAERIERLTARMVKADEDYKTHQNYQRFCRERSAAEDKHDSIEVARQDIEKALEACRDDLVEMQDAIRRKIA